MTPTLFIRADASAEMGTGHIMRCLTLAMSLQAKGFQVSFICRDLPGNLNSFLKIKGFTVHVLPAPPTGKAVQTDQQNPYAEWLGVPWQVDAAETVAVIGTGDWLIVDHYALDARWEQQVQKQVRYLFVIDDLANRSHQCDILLDQNLYPDAAKRYQGLLPTSCECLLGPQYALLRSEFQLARANLPFRDGQIRHILVCLGGSDPTNETAKVLAALARLSRPIAVDVVVGQSNQQRDAIAQLCTTLSDWSYHCQIDYMSDLMIQADLAIGAGGSTSWERCCLGLPSLVAVTAANQLELTVSLAHYGAIVNLGWADALKIEDYLQAIAQLNPSQLQAMSQRGIELVDGQGCDRVIEILTKN